MGCACRSLRWTTTDQSGLCWACPDREGARCGVSGESIQYHVVSLTCAGGRISPRGRVHWWGIGWVGVPWPIRLAARIITSRAQWSGCGCVVALRLAWARLRRWCGQSGRCSPTEQPNMDRPTTPLTGPL